MILTVVALLAVWFLFLGWLIVTVVGWFGPDLALWQGMVIAVLITLIMPSGK